MLDNLPPPPLTSLKIHGRVLQRELAAGRTPEPIMQMEFVGEPLDLASIERWRNRIMRNGLRP
jgi:hypothetical protein